MRDTVSGSRPSCYISMTQELIANMLGVRREGVTAAAGKLQDAGLISYRRGTITVLDRPGLEGAILRPLTKWSKRSSIVSCPTSLRSCSPVRSGLASAQCDHVIHQ